MEGADWGAPWFGAREGVGRLAAQINSLSRRRRRRARATDFSFSTITNNNNSFSASRSSRVALVAAVRLFRSSRLSVVQPGVRGEDEWAQPLQFVSLRSSFEEGQHVEVEVSTGPQRAHRYGQAMQQRENGREIQEKLLDILAWFADWKASNDAAMKEGKATEYNFLPSQTWNNLNRLVLGLVVTIDFYCIKHGYELVPRKMNTDPCENHFANARQSGGSTGAIDSTQADLAAHNQGTARIAKRVGRSNNEFAPALVKGREF